MAYVIAEPCIGTKDNSCVEVCPVDCIHPTPDEPDYDQVEMLYIDPEECIDCDACVEACPVDACFAEDQLPEEWEKYIGLNARYYQGSNGEGTDADESDVEESDAEDEESHVEADDPEGE
jgi:NAD-dependent dihydropyrimidine dehydrogenase PreA subunit